MSSSSSSSKPSPKPTTKSPPSRSHLAMAELKSRILSSLSKLSDRDTYHVAISDLETLIRSPPSPDSLPLLLSSLLSDPHRESLRLLSLLATSHPSAASPHLSRILSSLLRHLKDPASRDSCRDAAGALAATFINAEESSSLVGVFVRPLLEAMGEQSRNVQVGAAMCLARVVECGGGGGGGVGFGKLCPRVCKMVAGQGVVAKGPLLSVFASLSQVPVFHPEFVGALCYNNLKL